MKRHQLKFKPLHLLVVFLLAVGIFLRFYNLDKKIYWIDEVHTSLRVAGYRKSKFDERIPTREILTVEQLHQFQTLSPENGWNDTIDALAENAEHAPIYYLLTRLWMQWFGSSAAVTRSLAAAISLLAFPAIYWLAIALFESPTVGWFAICLLAVSPLHLLYAQEARQYSLWTVTTLLSSVALLRGMKLPTRKRWAVYGIAVFLGFYSHLISGLVFFGQGLYVGLLEKFRWTKRVQYYLWASLAGGASLIPWIIVYFDNESTIGQWMGREIPLGNLGKRWVVNLTAVFFDLHSVYPRQLFDVVGGEDMTQFAWGDVGVYAIIPVVMVVGYAFYFLCRSAPRRVWLFLLSAIAGNGVFLMLYDIVSGGQRSGIARYLFPSYLAIQLAVAYLFARKTAIAPQEATGKALPRWGLPLAKVGNLQQFFWQLLFVLSIAGGIFSCAISAQAETWWHKYSSYYNAEVAAIANQAETPLVISSPKRISRLTSLSYKLHPKVRLWVLEDDAPIQIPQGFSDVLLFRPSIDLYGAIEQHPNYQLTPLHPFGHIWQVERQSTAGD